MNCPNLSSTGSLMHRRKWSGGPGPTLNCWPAGTGRGVETIIHKFDLEPGGLWLGEMKWGDKSMLSKVVFQEVSPTEKLTWLHSSCDAEWNVISNPMMPDWPQTILTIVTLEQRGQKTHLRLTWIPHEASEAEIACFSGSVENMGKGWGSGFAIIDEILVELQAG